MSNPPRWLRKVMGGIFIPLGICSVLLAAAQIAMAFPPIWLLISGSFTLFIGCAFWKDDCWKA